MTVSLSIYAADSESTDEKVYGLIQNTDNTMWLVSTITRGDFLNWQMLKSFDQLIYSTDFMFSGEMQIKAGKIYILIRRNDGLGGGGDWINVSLFIIPIEDIANLNDMAKYKYDLPKSLKDMDSLWQCESFLIQPTVYGANIYVCVGQDIYLSKDDKRDDWIIFQQFDDYPMTIKSNRDVMAFSPLGNAGSLYLAPLGSNKFQKFKIYDTDFYGLVIYTMFFHEINTTGLKIITTLDLHGYVRTFTYQVGQYEVITLTQVDKKYINHFNDEDSFVGNPEGVLASSTQFGNKLAIGLMNEGNDKRYYFTTITIAQDAKISINNDVAILGDGVAPERGDGTRFKFNMYPLLYLDNNSNFYVSSDGGVNWQLVEIVLHPATN